MKNSDVIELILKSLPLIAAARKSNERIWTENAQFAELKAKLSSLPLDQMLDIITIMYMGRGDGDSFLSMREHCGHTFSSSADAAWHLLNKEPALAGYFAKAKERARMDALDFNNLPVPQVND